MTNSVPERGSVSIFAPNSRTGRKGGGWQKKGGGGMMSHSQKTCRILPLCRMRHHPRPFVTLLPPGPRSAGKPLTFWPRNRVLARIGPDPTAHRLCQNRRPGLSPGRSALFGRRGAFGVPELGFVARKRMFSRTEGGRRPAQPERKTAAQPARAGGGGEGARGGARAARPRRGRERRDRETHVLAKSPKKPRRHQQPTSSFGFGRMIVIRRPSFPLA